MTEVVIVGAGLAGLCCARRLHRERVPFVILESSDGVGGRIRTDVVDGFRLDRGFQVFLTSYPEARETLDYAALELRAFRPGALVRHGGRFHTLADPWRRPLAGFRSVFSPVGTFADKLRIARLRARCLRGSVEDQFQRPETTTREALRAEGFSQAMIGRFFQPFLGGIFLESDLETSSRVFHFVFRMFSTGDATLPAEGMEAIPRQLAEGLPPGSIRFGAKVARVRPGHVELESGEVLEAGAVVVATDGVAAGPLLGESTVEHLGVTCLYFAAPSPPISEPILVLNGDGRGPVNNLCVPTAVAPTYGPGGQSLVSATVLGTPPDDGALRAGVLDQLGEWFGPVVQNWRHLRTDRVVHALPRQRPPVLAEPGSPFQPQPGVYVCGDHRAIASINGAMVSGRRVAEKVLQDRA